MAKLTVTFDSLTPGLKRLAKLGQSPKPVLEVMGVELKNITTEAFSTPALRPVAWADKKSGGPSDLTDSTTLSKSIAVAGVTNKKVEVGLKGIDWPAAVHQFGSTSQNIPARPFFPFQGQQLTPLAHARIEAIGQLKLDQLLRQAGK